MKKKLEISISYECAEPEDNNSGMKKDRKFRKDSSSKVIQTIQKQLSGIFKDYLLPIFWAILFAVICTLIAG